MLTAGYLTNRTPSVLNGKTPYSILYGKEPTYDHLCTLGRLCYAHMKMGISLEAEVDDVSLLGIPKKGMAFI